MHILFVDDPRVWSRVAISGLESLGHQLTWVADAQRAQSAIAERVFDVCVADSRLAADLLRLQGPPLVLAGDEEDEQCTDRRAAGYVPRTCPPVCLEQTLRGIAESRRTTSALRQAEDRYRRVLDQVPALIWCVDRALTFTYINGRPLSTFGLSPCDVVGRNLRDFFPSPGEPIHEHLKALAGSTSAYSLRWKGIEWNVHVEPVTDVSGAVIGVIGVGLDVTDVREAEHRAGREARRYRLLFESSRDAIIFSTREGRIVDVNDAALELLGYTREEIHEITAQSRYVDAEDRDTLIAAGASGGVKNFPIRFYRKDNSIVECLVSGSITPDGEVFSIIRDVTAENAARRELKALAAERERISAHLREFIHNLPGVVFEMRLDTPGRPTITLGTGKSTDFLGYADDELVGSSRHWMELVHPDDRVRADDAMRVFLAGNPVEPLELRMQTHDGAYVWAEVRAFPVRDSAGRIVAMQGMILDIDSRKVAEEALVARTELLDRIVGNLPVAIAALSADGTTAWVNPAWQRLLGWSTEDLRAVDPIPLLFGEDVPTRPDASQPGERWTECATTTRDGGTRRFSWARLGLAESGGLLIGVDVTEQHELHRRLAQAAKLEAIGRLAGGVAHDFNNLLTVILGTVDLLLLGDTPMSADLTEDLVEIQRAAERAARLTRQLLAFSRRQVLHTRQIDLNAVVANLDSLLKRIVGAEVTVAMRVSPAHLMVDADAGQLEQVITNLVVNARDARPRSGTVCVETGEVTIDEGSSDLPAGTYASLVVTDDGCGIEPADMELLFEPFFTTKGHMGTGLGLPTVYGIVNQSGGHIRVDSQVGVGSRFEVLLPTTPSCLVTSDPVAATPPPATQRRATAVAAD